MCFDKKIYSEALEEKDKWRDEKYKFLVWKATGMDLGAQMLSLSSAFLLAMLTDRVILVDSPLTNAIIPPFQNGWSCNK